MGINQGSFMAVQLFDSETTSKLVSIARLDEIEKSFKIFNIRGNLLSKGKRSYVNIPVNR